MTADHIAGAIVALFALVFLYELARACLASLGEYRDDRHQAADDEWLARQNIAPLSSTVDRVWNAK